MPANNKRKLKFGIMCRGTAFLAWESEVLRALISSRIAAPALLIIGDRQKNGRGVFRKALHVNGLLFRTYNWLWVRRRSRALRTVSLERELYHLPTLRPKVIQKGWNFELLRPDDIEEIRRYGLDFILSFDFPSIRGGILDAARFGVWSYRLNNETINGEGAPGFWEISEGETVTGAILQRLIGRLDNDIILFQGFFKTQTTYVGNLDCVYFGMTDWCVRICNEIRLGQLAKFSAESTSTTDPIHRAFNSFKFLQFLAKQAVGYVHDVCWKALFLEMWNVALVEAPIQELFLEGLSKRARWLPLSGAHRFFADPFALIEDGKLSILVEEFDYFIGKGWISALTVQDDFSNWAVSTAIELPQHMSYPYLFKVKDQLYCVPETYQARKVMLFRATRVTGSWELSGTLLHDFAAVDPTLFQHQGLWWLFCTNKETNSESGLYAWYADKFDGPWKPHPLNPLKCDVRSARPGGRPFELDGVLYRPAQDCSRRYGGGVTINRIIKLTPTEFEEEPSARLVPDPCGPCREGLHTVCPAGEVTIIDGKYFRFSVLAAFAKIRLWTARRRRKFPNRAH